MSTVDLTPEKNNGPQRLTKSQRRLERLKKMAGKHALTSKKNYSHYKNVLDFIQDDAGMMETLFRTLACSWTDWRKFKGLVIIISFMAGAARRRKNGLAGLSENGREWRQKSDRFGHLISEKLYYCEQISSELEEIMMIKAKNAVG